jgi:PAS domain S-box-containing protein
LNESERVAWLAGSVLRAAEAASIGVMVTVADGALRIAHVNRAVEALFGRGPDELAETDPMALLTQGERERLDETATDFLATGAFPATLAMTATHSSGKELSLEVGFGGIEVDGKLGVLALIADVTTQKAALESLRRNEERFRSVVETIPEAIFITNGTLLDYANPAFRMLLDLSTEETPAPLDVLDLVHPEDVLQLRVQIGELSRGSAARLECRLTSLRGHEIVLELSAIGIEISAKPKVLWLGHDVTERKRLESKLLQADRLGVLGTLAAGMAHSINNPLAYTLFNLEHVARRMRSIGAEHDYYSEARVRLAEAHDGADRIAKVVRQMRALSRSRASEPGPVDIRLVLEGVLAMIGNEIRYRGQLVTRYDVTPRVWASEGELEQSFLGLLLYVARSLPENASNDREIRLYAGMGEAGECLVTVSDDGLSLNEDEKARLFDPFSSGDATGLGLAMCHAIFTSLDGCISVESYPNGGTIFRVQLPPASNVEAVESRGPKSVRPTTSPGAMPARARVLVIDDDPGVASTLRAMLEAHHEVRSVEQAREGLRLLLGPDEFDVVFCDLIMPEVSGVDVYCALELNRPERAERLVFMTGGVFTPEAERFLASVPNARIEKPFSLTRVEQLLAQAVEKRLAARPNS